MAKKKVRRNAGNVGKNTRQQSRPSGARSVSDSRPASRQTASGNVNRRSSKAVKKAMNAKHAPGRSRRRRGGNYILYYLLAAIIALIVFIILANTLLFNSSAIEVEGTERYTAEEITECSGLAVGDNLLHINTSQAEEKIVNSLAYIDMAKVTKVYPTKIKITVTEAEKWFCVEQDGVTAAISRNGKIVEQCKPDGLVTVSGFEAETLAVGGQLTSTEEAKTDIPEEILTAAEKAELDKITSIDMTDRFDIKIYYDNRITLEIGNISDIETKLYVAQAVISQEIGENEEVSILLSNPEKVAVKNITDNSVNMITPEESTAESETEQTSQTETEE